MVFIDFVNYIEVVENVIVVWEYVWDLCLFFYLYKVGDKFDVNKIMIVVLILWVDEVWLFWEN